MGRKNHAGTEDGKEILAKEKGLSTTRDSKREEMQENYEERTIKCEINKRISKR